MTIVIDDVYRNSESFTIFICRAFFEEAYRLLPTGGAIAIMDMNPRSEAFQKVVNNPFAYAAFKSTEPWLQQYVNMNLENELEKSGFESITVLPNSPRHRTVVAFKK